METRQRLILSNQLIQPSELATLLNQLLNNHYPSGLEILLDYSHLTNDHIHQLIDALNSKKCPDNLQLRLCSNNICDGGLINLIKSLSRDRSYQHLFFDFQHNPGITDRSIRFLAECLLNNQIADGVGFNFESNPLIDPECARHLALSLKSNTAITHLYIATYDGGVAESIHAIDGVRRYQPTPGNYQSIMTYCCLRNQLLQKYKNNPDLTHYILQLSRQMGYPCGTPPFPSLRYLAYQAAKPQITSGWSFFTRPGYTTDIASSDLKEGIADIDESLGYTTPKISYLETCAIF